jgi:transposase
MTLPLDVVTTIRRLHFAEHWKVGTIVAQLGVHHEAVERALGLDTRGGVIPDALLARRMTATLLDPYKPLIHEMLAKYPRLTATRLFEMVKARGLVGAYERVKVYVRGVRPSKSEAFFRLETLPGEEGQVDWGMFGKLRVGNAERSLCCFVMVLSYSRGVFARFFLDMTLESFLRGHLKAFESFGGAPRSLLYDNLKSVVLERHGDAVRFHPRLLELAGHYHFAPKPCAPYRGNEKGKVERTIRYLRDSFFAARRFSGIEDLNAQLARWTQEVALARPWPGAPDGRRVADVLAEEKQRLLPLPEGAFSADVMRGVSSGKTPYIRFDGNDYSVPHTLLRKPLTLLASDDTVRVLDGVTEVARHARSYDKGARVDDQRHLEQLAAQKRRAAELRGRDVLRTTLKNADAFFDALATKGNALGAETSRLLKLLRQYGPRDVDVAVGEALAKGAISTASVAHLLDTRARKRKQAPTIEVVVPESVRHVHVTPHALADYDALLKKDEEGDES